MCEFNEFFGLYVSSRTYLVYIKQIAQEVISLKCGQFLLGEIIVDERFQQFLCVRMREGTQQSKKYINKPAPSTTKHTILQIYRFLSTCRIVRAKVVKPAVHIYYNYAKLLPAFWVSKATTNASNVKNIHQINNVKMSMHYKKSCLTWYAVVVAHVVDVTMYIYIAIFAN